MLFKYLVCFILFIIFLFHFISSASINDCKQNFPSDHYCYAQVNDYDYIFSEIGKQSGETSNNIKYPQIRISENCINQLKSKNQGKEIAVGRVFKKSNPDSSIYNEITDIVGYEFYYINGNNLDKVANSNFISLCNKEVITYYLPIYTNDNSLLNKYMNVFRQNPDNDKEDTFLDYDIFNPEADIYNDICTTITFSEASENTDDQDEFVNYDITLHERRKYYFPGNIEYCPKDFNYKGIDKETFSSKCQTTISSESARIIDIEATSNPTSHTFSSFKADSDFKKKKKDIYFSMDVFKCIKLPFTSRGFKGNYGSYFMIALMIIVVICYVILLLTGKIHLLSVLELLYNSNIQSMNYLKQNNMYNNSITNNNNQIISYDVRNNNNQTLASNGQLLSNVLVGSNYLYNPNPDKISMSKKSNNNKKIEKEKEKTKKELMSKVDEQENDFESEKANEEQNKTEINNDDNKDVDIIKVKDKKNDKEKKGKGKEKVNDLIKDKEEKDEKISKNEEEDEDEDDENNEGDEESESNKSNKDKDEDKSSNEKDDKANPPKKKNENGGDDESDEEEDNGKKEKKRKSKNPIEISLNVKDLRDMMFKNQFPQSETIKETDKKSKAKSRDEKLKSKPKKKNNKNANNNNNISNGNNPNNFNNNMPPNFPFPYLPPPPLGMMPPYGMPPSGYPYPPNGGGSPYNDETQKLKKELEYQKELNERRDREMRREREDLLERERERQRQRDYDMDRERRMRDMQMMYGNNNNIMERFENMLKNNNKNGIKRGSALWNDDSDLLLREREKFNKEQDKLNRKIEKLEDEIEKKKEENEKITKDLNLVREEQRVKQIEYEKELLKTNQELKEKFEKEKKEIIDTKDREMQLLKEDKDKEIQKLKEDKDREINLLKQDMKTQMKKKDDAIKKKDKVIEKQKKETKELKKDLTTNNTFYTNMNASTFRQNYNSEMNNIYKKEEDKIDSPQVVVSINSIFTDQELNAMDFEQSCQFDKRSLCQVYLSYINRKQPLFFFFNYNNSSSGISIFQINYQSVRFIIICVDFMIYMFIYCTFFGTKSIALIYQKKYNFRRMCILGSIISPFCLIIRSIIHHFVYDPMNKKIAEIKMRCYTNFTVGKKKQEMKINEFKDFWESDGEKNKDEIEKKEEIDEIQDIENDDNLSEGEKARRKDKYEKRRLKQLIKNVIASFQKKVLISFIIMIFVLFVVWIYVSCFCAVYKNSQLKFFVSIIVCYGFSNLIPIVYCLVPTIFRQDAIRDESRFSFILANVFQII